MVVHGSYGTYVASLANQHYEEDLNDLEDRIVRWNTAFESLYGLSRADAPPMELEVTHRDGVETLVPQAVEGGQVLIRGRRYPVVGRITMDMLMVDLGNDVLGRLRGGVDRTRREALIGQPVEILIPEQLRGRPNARKPPYVRHFVVKLLKKQYFTKR